MLHMFGLCTENFIQIIQATEEQLHGIVWDKFIALQDSLCTLYDTLFSSLKYNNIYLR